jgi:hypothetical protein
LGGTIITCESDLSFNHSSSCNLEYITRLINIKTLEASQDQGHIMHTGSGKFDVRHTRVENLGRTMTDLIDSTVMSPMADVKFPREDVSRCQPNWYVKELIISQAKIMALQKHQPLVPSSIFVFLFVSRTVCTSCTPFHSRIILYLQRASLQSS